MSKTKHRLKHFVFSYASASVLLLNLACLSHDMLGYRSDPSILAFLFSLSAFVLGAFFFLGNERGVQAGLITNILFLVVVNVVDLALGGNAFLFVLPLWPMLFVFFLLRYRQHFVTRLRPFFTVWLAFGALVLAIGVSSRLSTKNKMVSRPNLILLVVEKLGDDVDKLAAKGRSFTRFSKTPPSTGAYFRTLYSGQKSDEGPRCPDEYLFRRLEPEGIGFKWVVQNKDALADTHFTMPYHGLRSGFLSSQLTWLPRLFGIDYHVFYGTMSERQEKILGHMSRVLDSSPPVELFSSEIEEIAGKRKPFFFLAQSSDADTKWVSRFVDWFHEQKYNESSTLIVTTDQGIANVPFLMFGKGVTPGVDSRPFDTVDITETILDGFGIEKRLNPAAVSLWKAEPEPVRQTSSQ